ncbi:MAG: HAD family hydrolase [Candidatus Pacebacteria bacterium]|nr:HAD family hydrolase [Candidatus Paceibacterota bacterium]
MNDKALIMFDFDGVLVDTLGICHTLGRELNEGISLEEYRNYFDGNVFEVMNEHTKNGTRKFDSIEVFEKKYAHETRTLTVPSEIKILLANLAKTSVVTVVSSTPSNTISEILRREGLGDYFNDIMGSDIHKSKVEKIKMLLEKYKKNGSATIFITDTVGDIKEARECNVPAIAVTWGYHERERLIKTEPFATVDTVPELASTIEKYFSDII